MSFTRGFWTTSRIRVTSWNAIYGATFLNFFETVMTFGHIDIVTDLLFKLNFVNQLVQVVDRVYPNQVMNKYNNSASFIGISRCLVDCMDKQLKEVIIA